MKKILSFILISCVFTSLVFAQNFIGLYSDNDGATYTGGLNKIATDNFGNVINSTTYANGPITVGNTTFPVNGHISSVLIKRDANNDIIWARNLSCGSYTMIADIYIDDFSNVYVCGYFGDQAEATELNSYPFPITSDIGMTLFIIKYSPNGTLLWANSVKVGLTGNDWSTESIKIGGNGTDKILIGSPISEVGEQMVGSTVISSDLGNVFIAGLNPNGDWQFAHLLPGTTNTYLGFEFDYADNDDIFYAISLKGSIDFGTLGIMSVPGSSPQDCFLKSDSEGNFEWFIVSEASSWWKSDVVCDGNDAAFFGSFGGEISFGGFDLGPTYYSGYGVKIDNGGNYIWAKKYGESEANFFIACKAENGYYITGKTSSYVSSNIFDSYELVYANTLPAANTMYTLNYLLKLDNNGNVVTGATNGFSFDTYNTEEIAYFNEKLYLTGNASNGAYFGYYSFNPLQINGSNYVATFSENNNIISGASYYDFDMNNTFDTSDAGCPVLLGFSNMDFESSIVANGNFNIGTGVGEFSLQLLNSPLYYTANVTEHTADFGTLYGQTDFDNDFIFQPIADQNDLVVDLTMGPARPGFAGQAFVTVKNIGTTQKTGVLEFTLEHPEIEITSIEPTAELMETNYAELDYLLNPTEQIVYLINFQTSIAAELDSDISVIANAPDILDLTIENNSDTIYSVITGSYDPNSKEVYPRGDVYPDFISNGEDFEYIINFQNTGNDTAFTVILVDTISNNLDLSTFRLISSSHNVVVNMYDNVIWFRFNQINLVDSVMNEELSHGFVKFSIKPLATLIIGDYIENTAAIYFDYNAPVITNTTHTEIITYTGCRPFAADNKVKVYPNPSNDGRVFVQSELGITRIVVVNIAGQMIIDQFVNNIIETAIDMSRNISGVYFMKIFTENEIEIVKLLKSE